MQEPSTAKMTRMPTHSSQSIAETLALALERRLSLEEDRDDNSNCHRLVHGAADGFPGVTVDRYGPALLVEQHREDVEISPLVAALSERFGATTPIFAKRRYSRAESERAGKQVAGDPMCPDLEVLEDGLRFGVHLARGEHVGLFLDSRPARQAVRRLAEGRRVLNLFAYTCGFGVAAAAGGARSTTNVDNKGSALEGGRRNYALNGLDADTRTFMKSDAIDNLNRSARGRGLFDLVIVDPPPRFRRRGGRGFDARDGFGRLVARCLRVLAPGGLLIAGLNARAVDDAALEQHIAAGATAADALLRPLEVIEPGVDFPRPSDRPTARFRLCRLEG